MKGNPIFSVKSVWNEHIVFLIPHQFVFYRFVQKEVAHPLFLFDNFL